MDEENQVEVPVEEVPDEKPEEPAFDVAGFLGLTKEDTAETIAVKVQEKLGTSLGLMQEALSKATVERAEEFTLDFANIAPHGQYEKLIEDNDGMAEFLKTEAHKPENWKLYGIKMSDVQKELISFVFANLAVDEGDSFAGYVFVTKTGKIKHAFAQVDQ